MRTAQRGSFPDTDVASRTNWVFVQLLRCMITCLHGITSSLFILTSLQRYRVTNSHSISFSKFYIFYICTVVYSYKFIRHSIFTLHVRTATEVHCYTLTLYKFIFTPVQRYIVPHPHNNISDSNLHMVTKLHNMTASLQILIYSYRGE